MELQLAYTSDDSTIDVTNPHPIPGNALRPDPPEPVPATALDVLTDREREVLALVAGGLSNQDITVRQYVSPRLRRRPTSTGP